MEHSLRIKLTNNGLAITLREVPGLRELWRTFSKQTLGNQPYLDTFLMVGEQERNMTNLYVFTYRMWHKVDFLSRV